LLDKIGRFEKDLVELASKSDNRLVHTRLDGWKWQSYKDILTRKKTMFEEIPVVASPKLNTELLMIGHAPNNRIGHGLVVQFITQIPQKTWLYQFGRVKMLLWVNSQFAKQLDYKSGTRTSMKFVSSVLCDLKVCASTQAKDYPTDTVYPLKIKGDYIPPTLKEKEGLSLIEITPLEDIFLGDGMSILRLAKYD
jgi:hypothetical protein